MKYGLVTQQNSLKREIPSPNKQVMDIVLIFNGLGNQMSQYAFYLSKRKQTKHCLAMFDSRSKGHNGYELDKLFNIKCNDGTQISILQFLFKCLTSRKLRWFRGIMNILGLRMINEAKNYDFNPALLSSCPKQGINYFWGGWHSEKNFLSVKDEVKRAFTFPAIKDEKCQKFVKLIEQCENSVSFHVRRGDYVNIRPDDFYQFGGVATLEYYRAAVDKMLSLKKDCTFFVFSNDIEWCREHFGYLNSYYVDCNIGKDSWRDMYLMTLCRHHINANSSFSWWGAWLSQKEGITICPEKFIRTVETKDIYPHEWIKISENGKCF